jgi:hypothetical protein
MSIMIVFEVVVVVLAMAWVINKICGWFDDKTGCILGAIVAGCLTIVLVHWGIQLVMDQSKPTPIPICEQIRTC